MRACTGEHVAMVTTGKITLNQPMIVLLVDICGYG
jgi:hypothetical protein